MVEENKSLKKSSENKIFCVNHLLMEAFNFKNITCGNMIIRFLFQECTCVHEPTMMLVFTMRKYYYFFNENV